MKKKKQIPDVTSILKAFDDENKFAIKHPTAAKERAMEDLNDREDEINEKVMRDFTTVTLGDYISAAHIYNRECMTANLDSQQRSAYYTLFAFEERSKRIIQHYSYIH